MVEQLRLLILEDQPTDADLAVREIRVLFPTIEVKRVETRDTFLEALSAFAPDLILSDFKLPGFDGLSALQLAKAQTPDTPFIIFTGSINEDTAVECMKAGANDYVIKDHMQRLGPAVQNALHQSQMRTQRKLAEEKSRRWKMIFDKAGFGLAQTDVISDTFIEVNATYANERGYRPEELQGESVTTVFPPDMHATVKDMLGKIDRMGHGIFESVHQRRDGSRFPVLMQITTIMDEQNRPASRICYSLDITERKQAQQALADEAVRRRVLIEQSRDGIVVLNEDGSVYEVNRSFGELLGYSSEKILCLHLWDWDANWTKDELLQKLRSVDIEGSIFETRLRCADGTLIDVEVAANSAVVGGRKLVFCVCRDISQRKQAEQVLLKTQALLNTTERLTRTGGWSYDLEIKKISWTDEVYRIHGLSKDYDPNDPRRNLSFISPKYQAAIDTAFQKAITYGEPYDLELELITPQDKSKWVRTSGTAEWEDGKLIRVFGHMTDVSEKLQLEQQLQQAQKMESVGRLAGGVAHDYNNLLSVILGYSELAMNKVDADSKLHADLMEIFKAGERSRDITRQLLAFARKQTIAPEVLDLNTSVEVMLKILRRLIGEDICLNWKPASEVWPIRIDPSQIDQILANLCVNARDAISGVGEITMETKSVCLGDDFCLAHTGFRPGEYVSLKVSDNGIGIEADNLDKIFEPFFTTKGSDKGTGLGLAMVYGIVKQNNGFIDVNSEPGKGTTFTLYFPRCKVEQSAEDKEQNEVGVKKGKGEKVLLVEDDTSLLRLTANILERLGYSVKVADRPREAIRIAEQLEAPIDLLITDVVMPEINGRDLAKQLNSLFPNLKCLFMSGYTADVISRHGVLDKGLHFIDKPFTQRDLSIIVRKILDKADG